MNFTLNEIKRIMRIARTHPDMNHHDCINIIYNGYREKTFVQTILSNVGYKGKPVKLRPSTAEILENVASIHYLEAETLQQKNRKRRVIRAKQQYILVAFLFNYTFQDIADSVSLQNHATALHHKNRGLYFFESELDYALEVGSIFECFPDFNAILQDRISNLINK